MIIETLYNLSLIAFAYVIIRCLLEIIRLRKENSELKNFLNSKN